MLVKLRNLPKWAQWMPAVIVLLSALLIGALIDAKQAKSNQTDSNAAKLSSVSAPAPDVMSMLDAAKRGDYQAQRNLAYGFAAHPYPGQEKNRVLGCAWYLVVLNSDHPQANTDDEINVQTYCGSLEKDLLETAKIRASQFLGEIKAGGK
jgi:hypothetical protein